MTDYNDDDVNGLDPANLTDAEWEVYCLLTRIADAARYGVAWV